MALPQRHIEILQTLAEHDGLTTAQVAKLASAKPGAETPSDTGIVSSLVYSLRNSSLLSSHDAGGKRVHRITGKGRKAIGLGVVKESESAKQSIDQLIEIEETEELAELQTFNSATVLTLDPENDIDAPFIQIISTLKAALNTPAPVKIRDRELKIDTLNRLGALMSPDITHVFNQIISDLNSMESTQ